MNTRFWTGLSLVALLACHKPAAVNADDFLDDDVQATDDDVGLVDDVLADVAAAVVDVGVVKDVAAAKDVATDVTQAAQTDDALAEPDVPEADALAKDTAPQKPANVLFLGNSYTYVNDLPGMTVQFAQAGGATVQQTSVTQGGATLSVLIAQTQALTTIAKGGWTHVVLQGQSVEPAGAQADFLTGAKTLSDAVHKTGAALAFYQTWPRKAGDALYTEAWSGGSPTALFGLLKAGYQKAATQNGGVRVPVGDAWMLVLAQHPEIPMYQADGSHPLTTGTYLAACVFSATLLGVNPQQVKWAPPDIDAATAKVLRSACQAVTQKP